MDIGNFNLTGIYNNNSTILPSIATVGQIQEKTPLIVGSEETPQDVSFADMLQEAITNTVSTDYDSKRSNLGLLLGESQDLHSIGIAGQKADIMLNLTVQIRDRVVEAYQEVMRMQI